MDACCCLARDLLVQNGLHQRCEAASTLCKQPRRRAPFSNQCSESYTKVNGANGQRARLLVSTELQGAYRHLLSSNSPGLGAD